MIAALIEAYEQNPHKAPTQIRQELGLKGKTSSRFPTWAQCCCIFFLFITIREWQLLAQAAGCRKAQEIVPPSKALCASAAPSPAAPLCDNCFEETCTMEQFKTPCCGTVYCPNGLARYLKDHATDREKYSPRCPACDGFTDFKSIDDFVKSLPSSLNGKPNETKRELRVLLADRCKTHFLCPNAHSITLNEGKDTRILACTYCQKQQKNPFFCRKCRNPVQRSMDECRSKTCANPIATLKQTLK